MKNDMNELFHKQGRLEVILFDGPASGGTEVSWQTTVIDDDGPVEIPVECGTIIHGVDAEAGKHTFHQYPSVSTSRGAFLNPWAKTPGKDDPPGDEDVCIERYDMAELLDTIELMYRYHTPHNVDVQQ